MLNLKKLLTKILQRKPRLSVGTVVTFPFSPTTDGIVTAIASVPTNALSYGVFADSLNNSVGSGYTSGGVSWATSFPVIQGRTYRVSTSSNANLTYIFKEFY